jgi:hypothetical protein
MLVNKSRACLEKDIDGVIVQKLIHDPASGFDSVIVTKIPSASSNERLEELSPGLHQLFFPPSHRLSLFVRNIVPPGSHNKDVLQFPAKLFERLQVASRGAPHSGICDPVQVDDTSEFLAIFESM